MHVLVPFAADRPKTRLDPVLSSAERSAFASAMLCDVLEAIFAAGHEPVVLSTAPPEDPTDKLQTVLSDARTIVDDRPLTDAVNARLDEVPIAVVMSDLPLVTPTVLRRFLEVDGDVAIAPGRGGGTNALVVRDADFSVDYHGTSYLDHLRIAQGIGASVREFDSHRLSTDVDEPADLVEVLSLSDGLARAWLERAGFELDATDGRVGVRRE
ncbi:2-phospho-L-lactate guanylyltransferase, coenzyme F420 biosynthesis enzyme, CobY/MobA/RfbA family [Halalkaliarchaeum sp. AArc-CO]|uniref:2-phospho-L-lactate guanylyltransferase n=1 Tax=Halalkaliarchaeum sp. AArc-CO TaxID=2866381 RepID=UPI00217EA968|nr:2-phospho-L-lactate guanylyltransferase [Halalkaliarchaeum sp. AArc-CO]UWG49986.1 2-phospho-L-lactate guanylyltransferase, coenzyme F420 biosynthesis enzyme, CobY/MobA/RfbA family [Halalkaliarchaeum sp. AArc-CO]